MSEDDFDTVKILVEVRRRLKDDAVYSSHRPLSPGDEERMGKWPSAGLVHVAHSLFIEMLRREAYTVGVSALSKGKSIGEFSSGDLEDMVRAHMGEMIDQFAKGASEEAHAKLLTGVAREQAEARAAMAADLNPEQPEGQ